MQSNMVACPCKLVQQLSLFDTFKVLIKNKVKYLMEFHATHSVLLLHINHYGVFLCVVSYLHMHLQKRRSNHNWLVLSDIRVLAFGRKTLRYFDKTHLAHISTSVYYRSVPIDTALEHQQTLALFALSLVTKERLRNWSNCKIGTALSAGQNTETNQREAEITTWAAMWCVSPSLSYIVT